MGAACLIPEVAVRSYKFPLVGLSVSALLLLGACSSPDVAVDPDEPLFTVAQAEALLFSEFNEDGLDPDTFLIDSAEPTTASVADYISETIGTPPATEPAECQDQVLSLVLLEDNDSAGSSIITGPDIAFDSSDDALLRIRQQVRHFGSASASVAFASAFRDAAEACDSYRVATDDGQVEVTQRVEDGAGDVDSFVIDGQIENVVSPGPPASTVYLRYGNVMAVVTGPYFSDADKDRIATIASAIGLRMTSKIDSEGAASQSIVEACAADEGRLDFTEQDIVDAAYFGDLEALEGWAATYGELSESARNADLSEAYGQAGTAIDSVLEAATALAAGETDLSAVDDALADFGVVDPCEQVPAS